MTVQFAVNGIPVQKGSMRAFARLVNGKPVAALVADNKADLRAWEHAVAYEAKRAGAVVWAGPVVVRMRFVFVRPPSVSAVKRPRPIVKPDLDKLVRAVLDGLTSIAFHDDAQVVSVSAAKSYGDSACALVEMEEG